MVPGKRVERQQLTPVVSKPMMRRMVADSVCVQKAHRKSSYMAHKRTGRNKSPITIHIPPTVRNPR
jgi:hypothetical protein